MTSGDDDDRPKRSWREIDQLRGAKRSSDEPRPLGRWAEAQAQRAADEYKKHLDSMFSEGAQGGAEGEALAGAMREAHGTPDFVAACTAYRDQVGWPVDPELLGLFLDSGEQALVVGALETILEGLAAELLELSKGLRSQIASLAESFDAAIADVAEEILERL
jgi:hypothetical protein